MTDAPPAIAVIGIGNEWRGDDGVGLALVRGLAGAVPENVALSESDGEATGLLAAMDGKDVVVLVDAVLTGAAAGDVHCWHWDTSAPLLQTLRTSTHTLSVVDALALAEALGRRPAEVIIIGIEARNFAAGASLSPAVNSALDVAVATLHRELLALTTKRAKKDGANPGTDSHARILSDERLARQN